MRGPGNGFNGRGVCRKSPEGFIVCSVPDEEFVIVSARCELALFRVPAKAAYFLFVCGKLSEVVFGHTDISMEDCSITRTRCEDMFVPCQ